jgi:hypothetical protein
MKLMRTGLFNFIGALCCLCIFFACENEQIIPVHEKTMSVETSNADRSSADISATKRPGEPNSLTKPVTGTIDGRNFDAYFTVREFTENGGMLYAQGYLTDVKITGKIISISNIFLSAKCIPCQLPSTACRQRPRRFK